MVCTVGGWFIQIRRDYAPAGWKLSPSGSHTRQTLKTPKTIIHFSLMLACMEKWKVISSDFNVTEAVNQIKNKGCSDLYLHNIKYIYPYIMIEYTNKGKHDWGQTANVFAMSIHGSGNI